MTEMFWEEDFQWQENVPLTDEQWKALPMDEKHSRQDVLALYLVSSIYRYRHTVVRNDIVVCSGTTSREVLDRNVDGMHYPAEPRPGLSFFFDVAA